MLNRTTQTNDCSAHQLPLHVISQHNSTSTLFKGHQGPSQPQPPKCPSVDSAIRKLDQICWNTITTSVPTAASTSILPRCRPEHMDSICTIQAETASTPLRDLALAETSPCRESVTGPSIASCQKPPGPTRSSGGGGAAVSFQPFSPAALCAPQLTSTGPEVDPFHSDWPFW